MNNTHLRIGEFARVTGLTVRNVRYYSDLGLITPSVIDPQNGYRFYDLDLVPVARRLVTLRELGLSIEEVGAVLTQNLSDFEFRAMLETHLDRLESERHELEGRIESVRLRLESLLKRMDQPMPDIAIKTTERKRIAYVRDQIDGTSQIPMLFDKLFSAVDFDDGIDVAGNIYHQFSDDGTFIDMEAALPVANDYKPLPGSGDLLIRVLEPTQVASTTHHGAFNQLHEVHAALLSWIAENGYKVTGPSYEWNLVCTPPVTQDNESYVTEVQVEVAKIS